MLARNKKIFKIGLKDLTNSLEIFVNQKKINFTLDKEKTLSEVLLALNEWGENSNLIIYSLKVDGEEIFHFGNQEKTDPIMQKIDIRHIKKIECVMLSEITYTIYVLNDFKVYLSHFKTLDDDNFSKSLPALEIYLNYFKKAFKLAEKILKLEKHFSSFKTLLKDLEIEFFKIKNQTKKYKESNFEKIIDRLISFIDESEFKFNLIIMNSFLNQKDYALKNLLENSLIFLSQLEDHLVVSSVNFQKSQTHLALQKLIEAVNGLELLFVIMSELNKKLKNENAFHLIEKNFNRYQSELDTLLNQIKESLNKKDFIEISDVLEYEIKEIIPSIKKDFASLMSEVEKTATH